VGLVRAAEVASAGRKRLDACVRVGAGQPVGKKSPHGVTGRRMAGTRVMSCRHASTSMVVSDRGARLTRQLMPHVAKLHVCVGVAGLVARLVLQRPWNGS
jgi:hypothetical protein